MSENTNSAFTLNPFPRAIAHVDCDAFFTSVEQALKPELKGKPVVTGRERGIVACASYEAKARGVQRPMRLFEARKICPELICLPSDYESYSIFSERLFAILRRFTPDVEEFSIDEAFADLSGLRRLYGTGYPEIAQHIKATAQKELGITVSVGLSASKTLAKIASTRRKPDGFTVVRANELHRFLPSVALEKVCGFGPNTVALLMKHGIRNVGDYVARPRTWAEKLMGKIGSELWRELRGECVYPVKQEDKDDYASISKCRTFTPPSTDRDFVRAQLLRNAESACIKLRRHRLRARAATVLLRTQEFRTSGVEAAFERATSSTLEIAALLGPLFDRLFCPGTLYRQSGVVFMKLAPEGETQYTLFDDPQKIRSFKALDKVIDGANAIYGKHALHLGSGEWLDRDRHESERGDLPERQADLLPGETARRRINLPRLRIKI